MWLHNDQQMYCKKKITLNIILNAWFVNNQRIMLNIAPVN